MQTKDETQESGFLQKPIARLSFLKYAGASMAAAGLLMAGCKKDSGTTTDDGINLGSGDVGILNYAYALEQLEAAFYTQVIATPYFGMSSAELAILGDLKKHEIAHRDFFKAAIGTAAIPSLVMNFTSIDFNNRASVLATAKAFEDLGVSAYNGAGKLIVDVNYLLLAGKIVSVEARHAAAIRDLINPGSADFSGDDVIVGGLDGAKTPLQVLSIASAYLTTKLNANNLPTS